MPDEPPAISPSAPPPPTDADYAAIHAAVLETERGRWFLAEYARRNRNADTALILAAIDRVEALWRERRTVAAPPAERLRSDLVEMAKTIAQTGAEIAAIRLDRDHNGSLAAATGELDSIVRTTAQATSDILAAAEQVQEIAWTLREHGASQEACDALDRRAADIYAACSSQDSVGRRTGKVVEVLRFLEERIRAMIGIWGDPVPAPAGDVAAAPHRGADVAQLAQPHIDRITPAPMALPAGDGHTIFGEAVAASADGLDAVAAEIVASVVASDEAAASATGDLVLSPAAAVVGATALALDPTPLAPPTETAPDLEIAETPEPAHAAEPAAAAEEPSVGATENPPEPLPGVEPSTASAARRNDPATLLKRILALIREPGQSPPQRVVVETLSKGPEEIPVEAIAIGAVATVAIAELAAARDAAPPAASADLPITADTPVVAAAAAPPPAADEEDDDILMPLGGPLTVDQAVDALLGKASVRRNGTPAPAAAPAEPVVLPEPEFAAARAEVDTTEQSMAPPIREALVAPAPEPAAEREPAAAAGPQPVADAEVALALDPLSQPVHNPTPEPAQEPALEPTQAALAEPTEPEPIPPEPALAPPLPPPPVDQQPVAEAAVPPQVWPPAPVVTPPPQVVPPGPAVASAPPPPPAVTELAPMPPAPPPVRTAAPAGPPTDVAAAPAPPPAAPPRHAALAALTALSDADKIALFS
jgi:chemotaxis protein CheZ